MPDLALLFLYIVICIGGRTKRNGKRNETKRNGKRNGRTRWKCWSTRRRGNRKIHFRPTTCVRRKLIHILNNDSTTWVNDDVLYSYIFFYFKWLVISTLKNSWFTVGIAFSLFVHICIFFTVPTVPTVPEFISYYFIVVILKKWTQSLKYKCVH